MPVKRGRVDEPPVKPTPHRPMFLPDYFFDVPDVDGFIEVSEVLTRELFEVTEELPCPHMRRKAVLLLTVLTPSDIVIESFLIRPRVVDTGCTLSAFCTKTVTW